MGKTYLVTGGLGFLGAPLVRALVKAGDRVRVLDNGFRGSVERLGEVREDVQRIQGDIRDAERVEHALRGVDAVCHLAFINGTRHFYEQPAHVIDVGVKGMINVVEGCLRTGVRELCLASSSEVYQTPAHIPTDESVPLVVPDPANPRYSYGGTKILCELMALHYGREHFERVLIFRPHNVFGPDMGQEHVIPQLTERILAFKGTCGEADVPLQIQGTGSQTRSFMYIDDCIEAIMVILERGAHRNIYHVGTMTPVAIGEVAHRIAQHLGVRVTLVPGPEAPGGTPRRCPDTRKLERLGFHPHVSFEEGLRRTVDWYATHTPQERHAHAASARAIS